MREELRVTEKPCQKNMALCPSFRFLRSRRVGPPTWWDWEESSRREKEHVTRALAVRFMPTIVYDVIIPTPATLFVRNMPRAFTTLSDFQESGPSSQRER